MNPISHLDDEEKFDDEAESTTKSTLSFFGLTTARHKHVLSLRIISFYIL